MWHTRTQLRWQWLAHLTLSESLLIPSVQVPGPRNPTVHSRPRGVFDLAVRMLPNKKNKWILPSSFLYQEEASHCFHIDPKARKVSLRNVRWPVTGRGWRGYPRGYSMVSLIKTTKSWAAGSELTCLYTAISRFWWAILGESGNLHSTGFYFPGPSLPLPLTPNDLSGTHVLIPSCEMFSPLKIL